MTDLELAIWSAAAGAIALVVLIGLSDVVVLRNLAAAKAVVYHLSTLAFVVTLSGLPLALWPGLGRDALHVVQVLVGPLCVGLGSHWVRGWLAARHRDRLMDGGLRIASIAAPLAGLATFALPVPQQLPAVALVVALHTSLVIWLGARAWLLGDQLALGIAIGNTLMLPAVCGLYALALGLPGIGPAWQALIALFCVLCIALIGLTLWKRNQHERRIRGTEPVQSQFDPVTKLPGGLPFVRHMLRAQDRRRRTQRDGAVIAVILFAPEHIVSQAGTAGLNAVYMHLAQRLQRQVGVVNPVGRYWDRCFVVLVETIHSPAALRTLGLRVASTLRRPMQVNALDGHSMQVRAEIGVGVVHLHGAPAAVEDLLHEAQHLAEAARTMASRAATRDPATGETVPVEHAQLGGRPPPTRRRRSRPATAAAAAAHTGTGRLHLRT